MEKKKYETHWPSRGALYGEGRWNKPGQWIVYCSDSIALCKLEILANSGVLPVNRVVMTIEIKDDSLIYNLNENHLPTFWWTVPYPELLSNITTEFLQDNTYLAMKVPSAQSRRESNYLLNPSHAEFHNLVKLLNVENENFDPRLKKL